MRYISTENIWKQYFILNKDLLLIRLHCWEESGLCQKNGLVAIDLKHKTSSFIKVINDFYGNLSVPFIFYDLRNGYWTYSIQPEDLMENIENRLTESSYSENDRQILTKLFSTLKEGANNLVFIAKLKNEIKEKLF